jgi:hypothetical protein
LEPSGRPAARDRYSLSNEYRLVGHWRPCQLPLAAESGGVDVSLVFINYRTGDEESTATLIERELSDRFDSGQIFRASKSILPGSDFEPAILAAVRSSRALVAVIGSRWLEARDKSGNRRLDDKLDWTRREIVEAFRSGSLIIPILVGRQTPLLTADQLPDDLRQLATRQYLRFDHRDPDAGIDRLCAELVRLVPELGRPRPKHAGRQTGRAEVSGLTLPEQIAIKAETVKAVFTGQVDVQGDFNIS